MRGRARPGGASSRTDRRRPIGWGLLATTAALIAAASAAPAAAQTVTWRPERPVQGHLFVVRVDGLGGAVRSVTGQAGGEVLRFAPAEGGGFESLAPVPIETEGRLTVSVRIRYADGSERRYDPDVPVAPGDYRHERLTVAPRFGGPLSPEDQARLDRDRERAAAVARAAHATPRLWTADVVLPRDTRVTSGFGNGREFNGQVSSRHMGLDLQGVTGDTVRAPTRGVVELVDSFLLAGGIVYLNHGGGLVTGYFHLSEPLVAQGDTVVAGTPIGRVGATGRVTGPHLHWVARYGSVSLDPRSLAPVLGGR